MLGGGLGLLRDGEVRQFRKANGLSSEFRPVPAPGQDGSLWIGTFGGGLNRLKKAGSPPSAPARGCPTTSSATSTMMGAAISGSVRMAASFACNKELLNRCADGLTNSVYCLTYDKGDGLPTLECSGGFQPSGCTTAGRAAVVSHQQRAGGAWTPMNATSTTCHRRSLIEELLSSGQSRPERRRRGRRRCEFRRAAAASNSATPD